MTSFSRQAFWKAIFFIGMCFCVALILTKFIPSKRTGHHTSLKEVTSPDSVTHHKQIINGKEYAYTTRVGTITIYDKENNPTTTLSYTADTVDNVPSQKRPITFLYNGGPGSSSMLLRMASFGPKRVILNNHKPTAPAPYKLVDNEYCLLDKTDLVFIDMPNTGFGRALGKNKPADFYGVDKDVHAFAAFIKQYIQSNNRWNSPKFLLGESYGTTRSAVLANYLQHHGIQLNGIVLLSSILNYGLIGDHQGIGDWQYVLSLPSFAASAWHFHATDYHPQSLETLLREVEHFAITEYVEALAEGTTISSEKLHHIAKKLAHYLGLPASYIERKNLRLTAGQFLSTSLKDANQYAGRYDARFTFLAQGRQLDISGKLTPDPTMVTQRDALLAATEEYFSQDLHYTNPVPYRPGIKIYTKWNFRHGKQRIVNSSIDLINAMIENPYLRVFSGNGYYDFATPYFATIYTFQHLNLPESLQNNIMIKMYPAGHMIYLDPKSLMKLKLDLDQWYDMVLNQ